MTRSWTAFTFDVDVDEGWNADHPSGVAPSVDRSQGLFDIRRGVPDVLEVLREKSTVATFFVPGRVAERFPDTVASIVAAGHELAVHGFTHRSPVGLSIDEERAEIEQALDALSPFGVPVRGYRSPSWAFSDATIDLLVEYGFTYSSNNMDDYRPYAIRDGLVEVPVHWMLDDAAHFWFAGSTWNKKISTNSEVREIWTDELRGISGRGGATVLTFHPQIIGRPGRIGLIDDLITAARDVGSTVTTCGEIADAHLARPERDD